MHKVHTLIGRTEHIQAILELKKAKTAQMVVCQGRRRIGKSYLIRHIGSQWPHYIEIQGLAPHPQISNQDQLDSFMKKLSEQTGLPNSTMKDWDSAFRLLGKFFEDKTAFIFLDEISWLGGEDPLFCGTLKTLWDTLFSKNKKLVLVLCGSVSSWIENNILQNTNFLGRISMQITLRELALNESKRFFHPKSSSNEILKYLLVTGGVPRYLEEVQNDDHATNTLTRLLLKEEGFLFNEYEKIFIDIFGRRHKTYTKIIDILKEKPMTFTELCSAGKIPKNGKTSTLLHHLILSGFLRKSETWDLKTENLRNGPLYRLTDNYLLFYKRAILPLRKKIIEKKLGFKTFDQIPNVHSIFGYQFENLIYNNIDTVFDILNIEHEELINWGPFYQTKTLRSEACQIDLLIQTKTVIYIFEIKHKALIDKSVINELHEKQKKIKYPNSLYSLRTGVIYSHDIAPELIKRKMADYFVSFDELLKIRR